MASLCLNKITELKSDKFIIANDQACKGENHDDKIFAYVKLLASSNRNDMVYLLSNDKDFKLKNSDRLTNLRIIESKEADAIFRPSVHSAETANRSLCLMAKMKFGYKDRAFQPIEEEPYVYQDGDRFCLAKTYYSLLQDPATKRGDNDRLINNEKEYIPTRQKFENNFYDEPFEIPVLVERDLNKG